MLTIHNFSTDYKGFYHTIYIKSVNELFTLFKKSSFFFVKFDLGFNTYFKNISHTTYLENYSGNVIIDSIFYPLINFPFFNLMIE